MTDIDRLERLTRLHESGAITDEEFQSEKAKVFADSEPNAKSVFRPVWLVFGILFVGTAAAFLWSPWSTQSGQSPISNATRVASFASAEASQAPVAIERQNTDLAFAASTDVLGVTPGYIEKRLGIPREKHDGVMVFEVGGCTITYNVTKNQIKSFLLDVSRDCQPTVQGVKITPRTTFGELAARDGSARYVATCLTACGNAADPIIELTMPAAHANKFIETSYWSDYLQSSDALQVWEKSLRRRLGMGEFDVPEDTDVFRCNQSPPSEIKSSLRKMTVKTVYVSSEDNPC